MDRFIVSVFVSSCVSAFALKSNMDRFIVVYKEEQCTIKYSLKSNMDRFIVFHLRIMLIVIEL